MTNSEEMRVRAEEDSAEWERYVQKVAADEKWRRSLRGRIKLMRFWWRDRRRV